MITLAENTNWKIEGDEGGAMYLKFCGHLVAIVFTMSDALKVMRSWK